MAPDTHGAARGQLPAPSTCAYHASRLRSPPGGLAQAATLQPTRQTVAWLEGYPTSQCQSACAKVTMADAASSPMPSALSCDRCRVVLVAGQRAAETLKLHRRLLRCVFRQAALQLRLHLEYSALSH